MTLQERMNTINGDGKHDYTFREALNKRLKAMGTHNSVNYSNIALQRYTEVEVMNIIYESNPYQYTVQEIFNKMRSNSSNHTESAQEALNQIANLSNWEEALG